MTSLFHSINIPFGRASFHCSSFLKYKQRCPIEKRAELLTKLIKNNEKKKHWHLQIGATGSPEKSIYNKVPRPHKRATVLNSLFMTNITDVLSTGDVCPEIMGCGVEITGVRVTSGYHIVNVFWQMSNVTETCDKDVGTILAKSAPDIRGELIRRNVLGKVPRIYFIRDPTNNSVSEFQKCLKASKVHEVKDSPSLPAEDLMKNIYHFTEKRATNVKKVAVEEPEKPKVAAQSFMPMPEKPQDMKSDVMGLNHEQIFKRVLAAKKKPKNLPEANLSMSPHITEDGDEFDKHRINSIQADPLFNNTEREKQIKKFCVEQRIKWAKMNKYERVEDVSYDVPDTVDNMEEEDFEEDYFGDEEEEEEENNDASHTHL